MTLQAILKAHDAYHKALRQAKNLKQLIAKRLAETLPKGTTLEWEQGDGDFAPFEIRNAFVSDMTERHYLDEGFKAYEGKVNGVTKNDLRTITKQWEGIPLELLEKAFGSSTVTVLANGKVRTS